MSDSEITARAGVLVELGRYAEARDLLGPAVAGGGSARAWCYLAQCENSLHNPKSCLKAADQALALEPENEWAHRLRSIALTDLRKHRQAIAAARSSIAAAPQAWNGHAQLALASLAGSKTKEGLASANAAVRLNPHEAETHFVLGLAHDRSKNFASATDAYKAALAIEPDHTSARNNLGVLALNRGDAAGALDHFGSAVRADPRSQLASRNYVTAEVHRLIFPLIRVVYIGCATLLLVAYFPTGPESPLTAIRKVVACGTLLAMAFLAARWRSDLPLRTLVRGFSRRSALVSLFLLGFGCLLLPALTVMAPPLTSAALFIRIVVMAGIYGWISHRRGKR